MIHRTFHHRTMPVILAIAALLVMGFAGPGMARQKRAGHMGSRATAGMTEYLVTLPHTADQCLADLDAIKAMPNATSELSRWEWGCRSGDHTGYLMVAATSPDEALRNVPETLRSQAKVVPLSKFTVQQIQAFHEEKK